MKILIATDLHIHPFPEFAHTTKDGLSSRLVEGLDTLKWLSETITNEGCKDFWFLGDLFHVPGVVRTQTYSWAAPLIHEIAGKVEDGGLWLLGNHDIFDRHSHVLKPFEKSICVISEPTTFDYDEFLIGAVPYIDNHEEMQFEIEKMCEIFKSESRPGILLIHCILNHVIVGSTGFVIKNAIEVDPDRLNEFTMILGGDVHRGQMNGNVWYLGSTLKHTFNDAEQWGYAWILDTDTMKMDQIPNPHSPLFIKRTEGDPEQIAGEVTDHTAAVYHIYLSLEGPEKWINAVKDAIPQEIRPQVGIRGLPTDSSQEFIVRSQISMNSDAIETIETFGALKGWPKKVIERGIEIFKETQR